MEYDLVLKVGTLIIGLVGAAKVFYDLSMGRRGRMREEYKFAREFLDDVQKHSPENLHPFLREKGYQAIAGDSQMTGDEIEYLLSLTRPERALRDYVMGRPYLEHFPQSGNLQIKFKKKFEAKWSQQWRMGAYLFLYAACAFAAFAPWIFSQFLDLAFQHSMLAFGLCLLVFGPYAWFSLRAAARIYRAQMLVTHQDRHTQKIVLPVNQRNTSMPPKIQR